MSPVLEDKGVSAKANQAKEELLQPVWCDACLQRAVPVWIGHPRAVPSAVGGKFYPALQTRGAELFNLCSWDSGSVHSGWQVLTHTLKCTKQQSSASAWRTLSALRCLLITASGCICWKPGATSLAVTSVSVAMQLLLVGKGP